MQIKTKKNKKREVLLHETQGVVIVHYFLFIVWRENSAFYTFLVSNPQAVAGC